ncbi:MAG TPA: class I SAM-dependent methyltransferase [Chitinophagaceae bacterium]|jgi:SAM-dependent methyltransferase|nr:class I SAM-dependent methyltransferase [Chitinophagaceae bacterium]
MIFVKENLTMARISTTSWYKRWFNSPFYHRLYFERDEKEAKEFIHKLIRFLEPPTDSRMLDVACGRGRHSRILADMGFDVTGIDLSFNSIDWAKQFEKENLSFFQHDMRLPFWINYFDYAFNFFTSFGYFATRREHDDAMRTIAASLKPGGFFVIDYLNVHYAEDRLVHDELKNIAGTSYEIHRWQDDSHFYKRIIVSDASLIAPEEYTEKVAKFSLGDFTDMFSFQNMQVMEVFGDYNLDPYDVRKTPRLIIVARKKRNNHLPEKEKQLHSDGRRTDALT